MNAQPTTVTSLLPELSFLIPAAAGVVILLGRSLGRRFWQGVTLAASSAIAIIGLAMAVPAARGFVLVEWSNELRVDALSALLVVVIGGIGVLASLYSVRYMLQSE
ncbi:MAG: hypothetical protein ACM3O7_12170, partial [Acidobacteriota bacterium]